MQTPNGSVAELPKGYTVKTALDESISSRGSSAGQGFTLSVMYPVNQDGYMLIPAGTHVSGRVKEIKPPKFGLMKAKITLEFDSIAINGKQYPFPGKAALDMSALAKQGGQAAGEWAAKESLKYFIPVFGTIFLVMDVCKGAQYVASDKEITIDRGTVVVVGLTGPVRIPVSH